MNLYHGLINPTSIRLLTLNVSPGTDISCTHSEVDLAESPVYNALSYTWGSPSAAATAKGVNAERSCPITVNGQTLNITRNLLDFLLIVKKSHPEIANEPIWIDAVCINQEDTKEKTTQVRLMTKIYSQSAHVYVWLGDAYPEDQVPHALGLLSFVAKTCLDAEEKEADIWDYATFNIREQSGDGQPTLRSVNWEDRKLLMAFLQRTWFSRIWIVQEIVVARSVSILCGEVMIPWEIIVFGVSYIETCPAGDFVKVVEEAEDHSEFGCEGTCECFPT